MGFPCRFAWTKRFPWRPLPSSLASLAELVSDLIRRGIIGKPLVLGEAAQGYTAHLRKLSQAMGSDADIESGARARARLARERVGSAALMCDAGPARRGPADGEGLNLSAPPPALP